MDPDLAELIESSFDSVWSLELLLVLRARRDRTWTVGELISELRSSELVVNQSLAHLRVAGLVADDADGHVGYAPASRELDGLVAKLDEEYRSRPAVIRRLIVARPQAKLQSFADAFLFRKPTK